MQHTSTSQVSNFLLLILILFSFSASSNNDNCNLFEVKAVSIPSDLYITSKTSSDLGSSHFLEAGRWAGEIPMSMNVKSPSPPFYIFWLKNVTNPEKQ